MLDIWSHAHSLVPSFTELYDVPLFSFTVKVIVGEMRFHKVNKKKTNGKNTFIALVSFQHFYEYLMTSM